MSEAVLLIEKSEGITTLTLNRPKALNALSGELRNALAAAFTELSADADTGVVILTGSGRAFCAGIDLKELGRAPKGSDGGEFKIDETGLIRVVREFDRPVIGAINGYAITGGFELALMCDVLIASTEASFADTHARVGVMPGWGLSQKLPRLIGISRAKELSLTGNYLTAERAYDWGLVNHVVPSEEPLPLARKLAADMLSCDPQVMRGIKRVIDTGFAGTLEDGLRMEARESREYGKGIQRTEIAQRREQVQGRGRDQSK